MRVTREVASLIHEGFFNESLGINRADGMTQRMRTKLRTAVAADLDNLRDILSHMRCNWVGVRRTVYDARVPTRTRPRRNDEYPENDPAQWDNLAVWAEQLSLLASELATQARAEAKAMREH